MIIAGRTKKDREKAKKVVETAKDKLVKGSSYFDDGYQVGDVTKTILATGGNALSNVGKGFISTTEGVADALTTTFGDLTQKSAKAQASIWELFGNDDYAESLRQAGSQVKKASYENAKTDVTSSIFDSTEALNATKYLLGDESAVNNKNVNWSEDLNKKSVAGELLQSAEQGIGNIGAFVGLGALTGGSTAGTFATSFVSSYGNTLTNDLRNGASEKDAKGHAISSGMAEAISEQFFQGIPGLNQAGWADNLVGNSVQKYFGSKAGKVALKIFDSAGEGFEEIISNMLEATFEGIRNGKSVGEIFDDASAQSFFNNEQTRDAFWSAVISSAITNGTSTLISNQQKQSVLKAYAEENNISTKQAQEIFDSLVEKKSNLEDTKNFKEQVETQEGIEQGLINELRQAQNEGQQVDLNELLNQTPNTRQEMQFTLDQDEFKNIKSDKQKVLANDMARLNNVKENHELFKTVNAIQGANSTQQYHITTTEGLYEMGIVNKDANGNYTMPDGSPYVPRGLNYKDGDIYINADVGSQSGTQAVYHEMFESFKKASPNEYNEFKQMVTDIIGEENIQKEFDTYKSMYGEELTDDIRDEIINDKFGELAENKEFINRISDNRTLLQKFIDTIKDMVNYVKGTQQEKELIKLQRNLEKEFAKRYKETDFSGNKGETAYSLNKDSQGRNLTPQQQEYFKDSKVVDENGNLKVMYRGTPTPGKTVFESQKGGGNKGINEYGIYFTDSEAFADRFAYEQLPSDTGSEMFFKPGKRGAVEQAYLNIKNPLDFSTLTKEDFANLYDNYKSDMASQVVSKDQFINDMINWQQNYGNHQLMKGYLDLEKIAKNSDYDGIIARVDTFANNDNAKEYIVFNSNQIKSVDNTNPTSNPDIRYSLTKDNTGRELSEGQKEYFKDNSKELFDKDGNLKVAYHTTTNPTIQFNEFNPVGTDYYKFGEDVVNYYTDSKEMSGSYADQIYNMADTKRITSLQEAQDIVLKFDNEYSAGESGSNNIVLEQDGDTFKLVNNKYKYAYDYAKSVWENQFTAEEKQIEKDYENLYKRYVESGYDNNLVPEFTSLENYAKEYAQKLDKVTENMTPEERNIFTELRRGNDNDFPDYIQTEPVVIGKYNNEQELFKNLKQDIQKANSDNLSKLQYEGYLHITNPFVVDAENRAWHSVENKDSYISNKINDFTDDTKNKLIKLAKESETKYKTAQRDYENLTLKMEHLGSDVEIPLEVREMARVVKRRGTQDVESLIKGFNGYVNEYTLSELRREGLLTLDEYGDASYQGLSDELIDKFTKLLNQEVELNGEKTTIIKTAEQLSEATERAYKTYDTPFAYLDDYLYRDNNNELKLDSKDRQDIEELITDYEKGGSMIFTSAKNDFDRKTVKKFFGDNTSTNAIVKRVLESNKKGTTNYDGIIMKNVVDYGGYSKNHDAHDIYVTFNSNQFKAVDNLNPTENADIRYSMTSNENIDSKEIAPIGTTQQETTQAIQNELAPIREDLSNITEQMNNLSNQIETLQNGLETTPSGYVETYNEQRNENIPTRQLTEEDANTLQDALMNDEGYLRSLDEQANLDTENTKLINRLTNNVTQRLDLEKGQKETLRNIVKESIENGYSADEISEALQKEFSQMSYEMTNQEAVDARKLIRDIPIKVSDAIKTDIADYGKWKSSNFGKINFSNSGSPVDSVYAELNNRMPYFFPSDIVNPTDQLLKIAEVANMATKVTETFDIDADEFDNIADYIKNTVLEDEYNAQMNSQYDLDKNIQFDMTEDIAPTTIRTQESIDDYIENRDIAPVRQDMGIRRNNSPLRDRLETIRRRFGEMITNRNYEIDKVSKATGNRQIKFAGDMLNSVSGEAQYNVNNKQTDMNGNVIGKSVTEIFEPSKQAGLYEAFNDYLFNKSNIERHRVGKGSQVPEAVSQQLVKMYETENPQFKEWAKDVYKYYDNVLQEQVNAGLITQEQYDNYRGEHGIYRSYTPFYEDSIDTKRFYDNEGKLKPVTTLKRTKGNASDVSQLLSMEDAMAKQTYAYKRAIRQNELFKEIVSASEKYNDAMDMDVRDNPTNLNDSLYTTPEGDKVVTAYINGEKVSAKISDELFNELSGDNEARIKQFEEDFSIVTNPLQRLSGVRRNLLTTWNPTFLARNAIKDIQDAVINSKHTAGMLKNYIPGIKELSSAKTQTAQQFLALYGADNLYGDYSNISKGKKAINKFVRLNELIELAPRFAEFKASLQAGDSVQEAIYNAREVTTNFGRGGYITRALNRNGFTFLNANVQGLSKLVRNLSGENGVKGVTSVVVKGALFAVIPSIINHLLYGLGDDKDEEYEAIPDYIKDNYYLIKTEGNNFVRIPKGRINAVFGSLARRMIEAGEGEGFDFKEWGENAWNQIGVGDSSGIQTIFTPLRQAFGSKNGEAWYGGDIVPTRLQNKPAGEQTDAKIDAVSNFIGENLGISPYKINYVLDQYSGGIGDVILPYITPETKNGAETFGEHLVAPIKDAFVVNSTDDNKYAGEFYEAKDKAQIQSNSSKATDEDILRYKYMSKISKDMSDLYKERREVQADTTLGNKEKYKKVQLIQDEINSLAKEAMSNYNNFSNTENYSNVGDVEYYKDADGEWQKVSDDEVEFTSGLTDTEKTAYYNIKNKINGITKDYTNKTKDLSKNDPKKNEYSAERKENITQAIVNSGLDDYTKAMVYSKYYSNKDNMNNVVNSGYDVDTYITALNDIEILRDKYSKSNGYSANERKQRTIAYINSLNMEIPQKAMMIRQYYSSFRQYNNDIVNYVSNLDIPYEDKIEILKGTGMTVNGNNVSWK